MRKFIIASLIAFTNIANAQWITFPASRDVSQSLFAIADVKQYDSTHTQAWLLVNDWSEKTSSAQLVLAKCASKEFRVMQWTLYRGLGQTGGVSNSSGFIPYYDWPFKVQVPGSIGELYLKAICQQAGRPVG